MPDNPGTWITITAQAEGNDRDGFRVVHYWDRQGFTHKSGAVDHGLRLHRCDDFNVALVKGGRIESLWWMSEKLAEDEATLAGIAREIGIVATDPPDERADGAGPLDSRRAAPPARRQTPAPPPGGRGLTAPEALTGGTS